MKFLSIFTLLCTPSLLAADVVGGGGGASAARALQNSAVINPQIIDDKKLLLEDIDSILRSYEINPELRLQLMKTLERKTVSFEEIEQSKN